MDDSIDVFSIAKLDLAPGDIVVVRTLHPITRETAEVIRDRMRAVIGKEQGVLILDGGLELAVLKRPETEAMG